LDKASAGGVTDEELRRAKNISLSKTATQHESPERRLTNLAESIVCTGTALQTEEKFRRIKAVTRRDVMRLLSRSKLISRAIYTIGTESPSRDFKRGSSEVELVAS
jgi:predicted Zn-dependent peptidase